MTFEEALELVEAPLEAKKPKQLSASEKEILKIAWENQTYSDIADALIGIAV